MPIFVEDNRFGTIINITENDIEYKILFERCTSRYNTNFCKNLLTSIVSNKKFPFNFNLFLDG